MAEPVKHEQIAPVQRPVPPPSFSNSFWSVPYRQGLELLFAALEAACVQSGELVEHVQARAELEEDLARRMVPPALRRDGFAIDEGASVRMGFEALLTAAVGEARARKALADDLQRTIIAPFSSWSASHTSRLSASRQTLFSHLIAYETALSHVQRLKTSYTDACRTADEVEDEWNFVRGKEELGGKWAPRPDEVDEAPTAGRRLRRNAEEGEDDEKGDDEEGLVGRSGATGGSVFGALGRALTVRRTGANRSTRTPAQETEKGDDVEGPPVVSPVLEEAKERIGKVLETREVKAGLDWSKNKFSSLLSTVVGPQSGYERYEKARRDADAAEEKYKKAVEELDALRLTLEATISSHLPYLQRLESDRLRAATSVLKSFHQAISMLPKLVDGSLQRVGQSLELVRPEKDLRAIIERRRTGPFQPQPVIFQSHYSEPSPTTFGIDLCKFDETNAKRDEQPVPPVLEVLLEWVGKKGESVDDGERRKSWLYETPLSAQHALRSLLNNPANVTLPASDLAALLEPFDLPLVCSVVKFWLLELEQPPLTWNAYEELRSLYGARHVIADGQDGEVKGEDEKRRNELATVVGKLPKVHFEVLKAVISHLAQLVESTTTSEPLPTYLHKLSISLSRPLLRPKTTTALNLDDRFPASVITDLVTSSSTIFSLATEIAHKEREERYRPRRQRTKPIDQRPRRSNLGLGERDSVDKDKAKEVLRQTKRESLLGVDTALAPGTGTSEGKFAASPLSATHGEFPKPPVPAKEDEAPEETPSSSAEKQALGGSAVSAEEPTANATVVMEEAQKDDRAARGEPSEDAFVPPVSPGEAPAVALPSTEAAREEQVAGGSEEKPLAPSSSLKRSSGPSRLRGARAPRPPSQVMAKVAAFEGGEGSSSSSKRDSWTRTRTPQPGADATE
ncbi:rho GTPase-activating protein [Rhodotorula toruloides]|uniref:Rho GTPase-activating protein n=1 Tax=Rhodotorula toruloides TaxID=5286 RepID=A0A511KPB6_RHOTO|nr:rho GTPase-activating protein [Rhodotorula toruloides]